MKRFVVALVVCGMVFSFAAPSFAGNAMEKLGRGLANVGVSPLELPEAMWDEGRDMDAYAIGSALTVGVIKGAFNVIKRAVVGVYEVATFPFPVPAEYEPIIDPPALFESSDPGDMQ